MPVVFGCSLVRDSGVGGSAIGFLVANRSAVVSLLSFGYGFPCDGPGRGGTCDISAFDGLYLAIFWMLNTVGWITFYWHWKHLALASDSVGLWRDGSL